MSKTAKRLGRGLDSLVSNLRAEPPTGVMPPPAVLPRRDSTPPPTTDQLATAPQSIGIDLIEPNPFQPRRDVPEAEIESLAGSIAMHGIIQPVTVRRIGGKFQLVAGERRWRAAKRAGLAEIPAMLRAADDRQMLELALVENLQREDLNPIDRARAYQRFCHEFGLSAEQVGERVGEDRSTVSNYLRLLDLEPEIQLLVANGKLSTGHARCLLSISNLNRRRELANLAASGQLSVRSLEEMARQERTAPGPPPGRSKVRPAHLRDLETRFEHAVKTKVSITESRRKGAGRIVIEYYNLDDFDRIASLLGVRTDA